MTNKEKLEELIIDVFLLEPDEFSFDMLRENVETWDSLGLVAMAVGVNETFGYHLQPDEANSIKGVGDIITLLTKKGITFE